MSSIKNNELSYGGTNKLVVRKAGAFADVSIAKGSIARNEVIDCVKLYPGLQGKGSVKFASQEDPFKKSKYDLVDDLVNKMDAKAMAEFVETKLFEIVVHGSSLDVTDDNEPTVLDDLHKLGDIAKRLKKVSIKIVVPAEYPVGLTKAQFRKTSAARFLRKVVDELNLMDSLTALTIILNLPDGTTAKDYQHLVLPFNGLQEQTFNWGIMVQHGSNDRMYVSRGTLNRIEKKAEAAKVIKPQVVGADYVITTKTKKASGTSNKSN